MSHASISRSVCVILGVLGYVLSGLCQPGQPLDSLLSELQAHPQKDDRRAELLNGLAYLLHTSDPQRSIAYATEVIGFANQLKDRKNLANAYTQQAIARIVTSDLDSAKIWGTRSLELQRELGHKEGIAASISNLGLIYYRLNNYQQALAYFQEAAQLFNEVGSPTAVMIYLNMSAIYAEIKNFRKAEEYIFLARKKNGETGDKRIEAYALLNLGTLYTDEGDYEKGRQYLDSALYANQVVNDQANIAKVYGNLGSNYSRMKDYRRSNGYYKQALAINNTLENVRSIAANNTGIGENYIMLDSLSLAYSYLSRGLSLGKSAQAIDVQRDASGNLSRYFEQIGRYDSALYYNRQHALLKDSLYNESSQKELTRLELQYDFDLKEQGYIQQQAIDKLQIKQLWLYGALAIVLVGGVTGYFLNRSRLRGIRMRTEMREQELTLQAETLLFQQQLSESELKAIRAQMNPHFIFNVLNSLECYILENDSRSASKLVQQFAQLTRIILENSTQSMVTAEREWLAVQLYVELEDVRFDHTFDYLFEADPSLDLTTFILPPMLIQPLVENAILHGLRHIPDYRGQLEVRMTQTDGHILITVVDNGIGLATAAKAATAPYKEKSIGIRGINERLDLLRLHHPESCPSLTIDEIHENGKTGTRVCLRLPLVYANFQSMNPDEKVQVKEGI